MSSVKTHIVLQRPSGIHPGGPGALRNFRCLDPMQLEREAARLNLEVDHWIGKPNCFYNPRGPGPGRAFVLLTKGDVKILGLGHDYKLQFAYGTGAGEIHTISELRILKAHALYSDGFDPGDATPYLVELVDKRGAFHLSALTNHAYNVLCPAPPADADAGADYSSDTDLYYEDSLDAGAFWTWQTMLADIWDELPGQGAGDCPTLPSAPDDKPRNFRFVGVSAWDAFHVILKKIGAVLNFNPFTRVFTVSYLATEQDLNFLDTNEDLLGAYTPVEGSVQYPATVRVLFHRREEHHGSEKEVQRASGNWIDGQPYAKDIATGLTGAVSGTVLPIWDDMPAIYSFDGTHLNQTQCDARATEIVADLALQLRLSNGNYRRMFRGIKTDVMTGSKIASVTYGDRGGDEMGMTTEYRGSDVPDPLPLRASGNDFSPRPGGSTKDSPFFPREHGCRPFAEPLLPTDIMRQGFPDYPRLMHMIEITGSKAYGVYPAKIVRVDPEQDLTSPSFTNGPNCYAFPLDGQDLETDSHVMGRLIGTANVGSDPRPLLAVGQSSGSISLVQVQPDTGKRYATVDTSYGVFDGTIVTFDPDAQSGDLREGDYDVGDACWILTLRHRPEAMAFATYSSSTGAFTLGEKVTQEVSGAEGYLFEEDTTGDVLSIHMIEGSAAFVTGGATDRTITGATSGETAEMDSGSGAAVTVPQTTLDEEKVNLLAGWDIWKGKFLGLYDAGGSLAERPLYAIDEEPYVRQFEFADADDHVQGGDESWPLYFDGAFVGQPGEPLARIYMPCELGVENASGYVFGIGRHGETGHKGSFGFSRWSKSAKRWEMIEGCFKLIALGVVAESGGIPAGVRGTVSLWWKQLDATPFPGVEDSNADVEALNWNTETIEEGSKVIMGLDRQENLWMILYVDRPVMVANDEATPYIEPIGKLTFDTDVGEVYSADFTQQFPILLSEIATGHVKVQVFGPPSLKVTEDTVNKCDPCYTLDFEGAHFNVTFVAPHNANVQLAGLTWSGDPNGLTNMNFVGGLLTSVT